MPKMTGMEPIYALLGKLMNFSIARGWGGRSLDVKLEWLDRQACLTLN